MRTIADYWKEFAVHWEESSYEHRAAGLSLVERLATRQREHILARRATAERRLASRVAGARVLEIGCGGGALCIALARWGAAHVVGIDVSDEVISVARAKAAAAGIDDRVRFLATTVENAPLDQIGDVDLLVGLGILEYLRPGDVSALIARLKPRQVFLSYDERRVTLKTALHAVYRGLKRLPFYQKYRAPEIRALVERAAGMKVETFRDGNNSFVASRT